MCLYSSSAFRFHHNNPLAKSVIFAFLLADRRHNTCPVGHVSFPEYPANSPFSRSASTILLKCRWPLLSVPPICDPPLVLINTHSNNAHNEFLVLYPSVNHHTCISLANLPLSYSPGIGYVTPPTLEYLANSPLSKRASHIASKCLCPSDPASFISSCSSGRSITFPRHHSSEWSPSPDLITCTPLSRWVSVSMASAFFVYSHIPTFPFVWIRLITFSLAAASHVPVPRVLANLHPPAASTLQP